MANLKYGDSLHKEYPKTCAKDDFWGQVCRTVNGKPVDNSQIELILETVRAKLSLSPGDSLFDIGCGNGALARFFFNGISTYLGIDFSEFLISVAKENFEKLPYYEFHEAEVEEFLINCPPREEFTKALCYGVFAYLDNRKVLNILNLIRIKFPNVEMIFLGNLPDSEKAKDFYRTEEEYHSGINDKDSPIGLWRSRGELSRLFNEAGWSSDFTKMPNEFYASTYRYDVLLRKN